MARKLGIWGDVDDLLKQGVAPQVSFPKAAKVISPKRPPGRPRLHPLGSKKKTGPGWIIRTARGHAMRCRAKGCRNRVPRKGEAITCSEKCRIALADYCTETLAVLEGKKPATEYPHQYRSHRLWSKGDQEKAA